MPMEAGFIEAIPCFFEKCEMFGNGMWPVRGGHTPGWWEQYLTYIPGELGEFVLLAVGRDVFVEGFVENLKFFLKDIGAIDVILFHLVAETRVTPGGF